MLYQLRLLNCTMCIHTGSTYSFMFLCFICSLLPALRKSPPGEEPSVAGSDEGDWHDSECITLWGGGSLTYTYCIYDSLNTCVLVMQFYIIITIVIVYVTHWYILTACSHTWLYIITRGNGTYIYLCMYTVMHSTVWLVLFVHNYVIMYT